MKNPSDKPIYRIIFAQNEDIKEIYAQFISEETLVGFIEADTLLHYGDAEPTIDPAEVRRCYIPLHTIIRIDEVISQGNLKLASEDNDNISHLHHAFKKPPHGK